MIKVPPPGSLIPGIDIINAPLRENRMRSRCINCSDREAFDCFGCLIGQHCEYALAECMIEDQGVNI